VQVLVTGSRGLIGTALVRALEARGDRAVSLSRGGTQPSWDLASGTIDGSLDGFDAVVHLAGEPLASIHWTAAKMQRIRDSRLKSTDLLAKTLAQTDNKPAVLVSGSAVGYYGNRGREELLDEQSSSGDDFLATLCREWEAAATPASEAGIRVANVRTGIVLSREGGVLEKLLLPFKLGVGGKIGSGRQYMSWITLTDEVRAILHIIDHADVSGPVNLTAPHPVTNEVFTKLLAEAVHRPAFMPLPSPVLRALLGRELADDLFLSGQRVFPKKLEASGFAFEHVTLEAGLRATVHGPPEPARTGTSG
jgi:uncharacterized protein (TIGR01777 family)